MRYCDSSNSTAICRKPASGRSADPPMIDSHCRQPTNRQTRKEPPSKVSFDFSPASSARLLNLTCGAENAFPKPRISIQRLQPPQQQPQAATLRRVALSTRSQKPSSAHASLNSLGVAPVSRRAQHLHSSATLYSLVNASSPTDDADDAQRSFNAQSWLAFDERALAESGGVAHFECVVAIDGTSYSQVQLLAVQKGECQLQVLPLTVSSRGRSALLPANQKSSDCATSDTCAIYRRKSNKNSEQLSARISFPAQSASRTRNAFKCDVRFEGEKSIDFEERELLSRVSSKRSKRLSRPRIEISLVAAKTKLETSKARTELEFSNICVNLFLATIDFLIQIKSGLIFDLMEVRIRESEIEFGLTNRKPNLQFVKSRNKDTKDAFSNCENSSSFVFSLLC